MITSPSMVARFSRPCRLVRSGFSCGYKIQTFHQREERNAKRAAYANVEAFRAGEVGEAIQVDQGIVVLKGRRAGLEIERTRAW
jgi:hypothetical protein